jgi:Fic family protein
LERTQKGEVDISDGLVWFLGCLQRAIGGARGSPGTVLDKAQFWDRAAAHALNDRKITVISRLPDGFEGKLTSLKWAVLAKGSQDTASGDVTALIATGVLRKARGGGRSTYY